MREMKTHFLLLFMIFFLFSCFWWNDEEVLDAKKWMWIIVQDNTWIVDENVSDIDTWSLLSDSSGEITSENKKIEINYLTDNKFLEFDDLNNINLSLWEVEITWKTLTNVDKIIVKFSNKTSDYPNDTFNLKQFKPWDKTFLYRAFSRYETMDFWENEYVFEAYSWSEVSKASIIINVEKQKELGSIDLIDIKNLPTWGTFGDPKELWNWKITYSDLKWLEIKKVEDKVFECGMNPETDNYFISEYLDKALGSYYWWNSCKPFEVDNWTSYFVLRLDWIGYKYEKHIFLKNWIYWVYELETWENLILEWDSIDEKNNKLKIKSDELKLKNADYSNLSIVNSLFKKLINN